MNTLCSIQFSVNWSNWCEIISKRAGPNKRAGRNFLKKLINEQGQIRASRMEKPQIINKRACSLIRHLRVAWLEGKQTDVISVLKTKLKGTLECTAILLVPTWQSYSWAYLLVAPIISFLAFASYMDSPFLTVMQLQTRYGSTLMVPSLWKFNLS